MKTSPPIAPSTSCPDRETWNNYLQGWIEPDEASVIENHLQECSTCESSLQSIENESAHSSSKVTDDFELAHLKPSSPKANYQTSNSPRINSTAQPTMDSVVDYALSLAKRLPQLESQIPDGSSVSAPMLPSNIERIGPYQLLRPLGQGGMGRVFLARHDQLEKLVAIKVFPSKHSRRSEIEQIRFKREARAAGGLNHPAIATATDAGEFQQTQFLAMEYVEGLDLSKTAKLSGPLPIADACEIARQIALGLSYAHQEGIIHRDIKPSNVMLSLKGEIKILDFGLARHSLWTEASAELTTVGQLMGTLDYMAPEQAECAATADYRADLYSLGATLFRLLVGRSPLSSVPNLSPLSKLRLLATQDAPRVDTLRPEIPRELANFVAQLLQRTPENRHASAAHIAEQLLEFCAGHDLPKLAQIAQERTALNASETEPNLGEDNCELPAHFISGATSPPIDPASPEAAKTELAQTATGRSGSRWFGRLRNWIAVAILLPFAFSAGVVVILESQKGELVIESEVENVSVKLLRDGEEIKNIKVVSEATVTRLYAGRYELTLDSPSDQVEFLEDQVEISRGTTVIARVRKVAKPTTEATPSDASVAAAPTPTNPAAIFIDPNEPVFEGEPLSDWFKKLETERSPLELYKTALAIQTLIDESNVDSTSDELLRILRKIGDVKIQSDADSRPTEIDYIFGHLARESKSPQAYYEMLVNQLKNADDRWAERLFKAGNRGTVDKSDPLVDWILARELSDEQSPDRTVMAANFLRGYIVQPNLPEERVKQVVSKLLASKQLPVSFWLNDPPPRQSDLDAQRAYRWPKVFAEAICNKSIEILGNLDAYPEYSLKSAVILNALAKPEKDFETLSLPTESQKKIIADHLGKHLQRLLKSPELLTSRAEVDYHFYTRTDIRSSPFLSPDFSNIFRTISIDGGSTAKVPILLAYLSLLQNLETTSSYSQECDMILRSLENDAAALIKSYLIKHNALRADRSKDMRFAQMRSRIGLSWPALSIFGQEPGVSFGRPEEALALIASNFAYGFVTPEQQTAFRERFAKQLGKQFFDEIMSLEDKNQNGSISEKEGNIALGGWDYDLDKNNELSAEEIQKWIEEGIAELVML